MPKSETDLTGTCLVTSTQNMCDLMTLRITFPNTVLLFNFVLICILVVLCLMCVDIFRWGAGEPG
jgi:hypothetical protein